MIQPKNEVCYDLLVTYERLISAAKHRKEYGLKWEQVGKLVADMAKSQVPELEEKYNELAELFHRIGKHHKRLARREIRNAEDYRDVVERFNVVYRVQEEKDDKKDDYEKAEKALKKAQAAIEANQSNPNFGSMKTKLEGNLNIAKEKAHTALFHYKRKLAQLVQVRNTYNLLKVQRMKHGSLEYANALKKYAEKDIELFLKVKELLDSLTIDGDVAEAVNEAVSQPAPEPADLAQADAQIESHEAELVEPEAPKEDEEGKQDDGPANPIFE